MREVFSRVARSKAPLTRTALMYTSSRENTSLILRKEAGCQQSKECLPRNKKGFTVALRTQSKLQ